jgi:hypothetical protein
VDADAVLEGGPSAVTMGAVSRSHIKAGLGAVLLSARYKISSGITGIFRDRWMRAMPVRVS